MKKIIFILLCTLLSGQQKEVKITHLNPKTENSIFPFVSYDKHTLVQEKINTFLQVSLLENIPNSNKNPFDKVLNARASHQNYISFYDWKTWATPQNVLSLQISGEATGAYSEVFFTYYNFDLRNGNLIDIKDVFTKQGLDFIVKRCNQKMTKDINGLLKELKGSTSTVQEDKKLISAQIDMYEDCLSWFDKHDISWFKYYFEKEQMTFIRGRCSNHAMRAIDDLGDYHIAISYQDVEPYLTSFGKSLLFNRPKNVETNNPNYKLYVGEIGGYPIHFLINRVEEDHSVSVAYWYDKYQELIDLNGTFLNNRFSLIEEDYHDENLNKWIPKANIQLEVKGKEIMGFWENYKTKKKLKIKLKEQ